MIRVSTAVAIFALATAGFAAEGRAQDANFFAGKQLRLIVATGAGGGYDAYARLLARSMGKYIAGEPAIVVQNMPGASGATAVNHLYSTAPRDGTVFATFNSAMPFYEAIGQPGTRFKSAELSWIGNLAQGVSIFPIWHSAGVKTVEDARRKEIIIGGTGSGGNSSAIPILLNSTLGTKFKVVSGYQAGADVDLAMERGEVQGRGSVPWASIKAVHPDWIKEKKFVALLQLGLKKDADLPNVPLLIDLAETDEQRRMFEFVSATGNIERPFAGPPELPADRLAALRKGFQGTLRDSEFLAGIAQQNLEFDPLPGEETAKIVANIVGTPPQIVEKTKQAMSVKD